MVDSRAAHTALVAVTVLVLLLGILIGGVAARAAKQDSTNGSVAYTAPATGSVRPPTATELETLRVAVTTVGKGWCALEWHATESDYQTVCHQA